jgi:DNA-binding CsgD family transcriptional regulator
LGRPVVADAWSPQALSDLIGSIYDCALDPNHWNEALSDIKEALCCDNATLHLNDLCNERILISKTVGIDPYWLDRIVHHSAEINARLASDLASWPSLDQPHIASRHIPLADQETSPYIRECWNAQGIVDTITYFLMHTPTRFSGLALGRHKQYGIITNREIELGALLLPHIRRAVTISNVLDAATIERARMADALNALRCAVLLTDARGTILHANRTGEEMLSDGKLVYDRGGVVHAKSPSAAEELRAALRLAGQDESVIGKTGLSVRLTALGVPPVFAHILPMASGELRSRLQPGAIAAVFIGAPPDAQDGAAMMAAAYDLTPTETRVVASLLAGHTLARTAAALAIAVSTANTHLDNIFSKTGVRRQADLIRLATRLVPPTTLERKLNSGGQATVNIEEPSNRPR